MACLDCKADESPIDFVIPRDQWLLINPEDGGYLCANCIVMRASKLDCVINLTGLITFGHHYLTADTPYEKVKRMACGRTKRYQIIWHWRGWGLALWRLEPKESLYTIYHWLAQLGPLEVRRWVNPRDFKERLATQYRARN